MHSERPLSEIIYTDDRVRFAFRFAQRRQKHARQDRGDRDYHKQFDQAESPAAQQLQKKLANFPSGPKAAKVPARTTRARLARLADAPSRAVPEQRLETQAENVRRSHQSGRKLGRLAAL